MRWKLWWAIGLAAAGGVASAADFGTAQFIGRIRDLDIRRVEDALPLLPVSWRENYTLVYASRSLQDASPSAPRAILYGPEARFIVTFNGDPGQRGYGALETLEFDAARNDFHFREIVFAPDRPAQVSEDNPPRCVACHGRPARPIWDTPPSWPGVYGERYRAGLSAAEVRGMRAFLARQPSDPRYRYLLDAGRLLDRATYVASSGSRYDGEHFEPPNARLSMLLATLNVRALVTELAARPAFAAHRYALLGAAARDCGSVPAFFPAALEPRIAAELAGYVARATRLGSDENGAKRARGPDAATAYHSGLAAEDPVVVRFLAERFLGLAAQRWSLALERSSYDLAAPEGSLRLDEVLLARVLVTDPDLRELRAARSFQATDAYCGELRRRSRRELSRYYAERPLPAPVEEPTAGATSDRPILLERCASCHTGAIGPALPFADPEALAGRLRAGGYPRGRLLDEILYRLGPESGADRMPRGLTPTESERRALEEYFLRLDPGGAAAAGTSGAGLETR